MNQNRQLWSDAAAWMNLEDITLTEIKAFAEGQMLHDSTDER